MKILTEKTILRLCLGLAGFLGVLNDSPAATTNVSFGGFFFNPNSVTIHAGDTVTWTGIGHTVTVTNNASAEAFCGSGVISGSCSHTFTVPGTYNYICTLLGHAGFGMVAKVIVLTAPPNNPPSVSITNPAPSQVFAAPGTIKIDVSASDSDGTVTNVQIYSGASLVGNFAGLPYSVTLSNLAAGPYILTAKATDNSGATTTSATVNVTVARIELISPAKTNGQFQFTVRGSVTGKTNLIQASSDLSNWTSIRTNLADGAAFLFSDPDSAVLNRRWYRVLELP